MSGVTENVYQRLLKVQGELVAPREISGKFGKARSAEQILEAAKPVCRKHKLFLYTSDELRQVGDRNYCVTTARVVNVDNPDETVAATAAAWENQVEMSRAGSAILDTSQVSGKTSSYAKKYALQNLFAIDDTKDADFDQPATRPAVATSKPAASDQPTAKQVDELKALMGALFVVDEQDKADFFQDAIGKMRPTSKLDVENAIDYAATKLGDMRGSES
jgi:hypothetical protein